ncbi:MAG: hypothetical protein KA998_00105 [Rickettsiaceae bacterium]|jgi:hypothetical protein|nr:hypothetical protein [Rickettsiaceae bacterium]
MLTTKEIEELEKLSDKYPAVNAILDFYKEIQNNGAKLLFIEINNKLSQLAKEIKKSDITITDDKDDKKFDRFLRLSVEMETILNNNQKMQDYINGITEEKKLKPKKGHEDKVVF